MHLKIQPYENLVVQGFVQNVLMSLDNEAELLSSNQGSVKSISTEHVETMFEHLHFKHQTLLDYIARELSPGFLKQQVVNADSESVEPIRVITNKLEPLNLKLFPVESALKKISIPGSITRRPLTYLAIGTLCLVDSIFTRQVWEAFGMTYIESVISTLLYSGALAFFAHSVPKLISLGKSKLQRRAICVSLFALLFGLFYFLGSKRAEFLNESLLQGQSQHEPWSFLAMSMFFMVTASAVAFFNLPTKEEKEQWDTYRKLKEEKERLTSKIKELENERNRILEGKVTIKNSGTAAFIYGHDLENEIITHAKGCYSSFRRNLLRNISHEAEILPSVFKQEYPFRFERHFKYNNEAV